MKATIEKGDPEDLARLMKDPIIAVEYKGETYVLDGHNRLKAFSEAGKDAKVTLISLDDARSAYKSKMEDIEKADFKQKLKDGY